MAAIVGEVRDVVGRHERRWAQAARHVDDQGDRRLGLEGGGDRQLLVERHWFEVSKVLRGGRLVRAGTDPRRARPRGTSDRSGFFLFPANGSTWGDCWSPTDPTRSIVCTRRTQPRWVCRSSPDRPEGRPLDDVDADSTRPSVLVHDRTGVHSLRHVAVRVSVDRRLRRLSPRLSQDPRAHPRYRTEAMRFAPTNISLIAVRYRDYEELPADPTRRVRRGDRPLAGLPLPGRRHTPARSSLRPCLPPTCRATRRWDDQDAARMARTVLGPHQRG